MKVFKSGLCLALTLSIVLGMTGCSAGGFSHKTLCNIAEGNDFDKCKKAMDFSDKRYNYAEEKQFYINAKDEDALPIFYTQIDNSRNSLDHDNVSEVTCLYDYTAPIITDDQEDLSYAEAFGTYSVIVLVSYDDKDDAKGFFEEEIEAGWYTKAEVRELLKTAKTYCSIQNIFQSSCITETGVITI